MRRIVAIITLVCFIVTGTGLPAARAQGLVLPTPGSMVALSPTFAPVLLKGIIVDKENPFKFEFIVDKGDLEKAGGGRQKVEGTGQLMPGDKIDNSSSFNLPPSTSLKSESTRLIKYFLAALTTPENDLWVNLSPVEKDRIVPDAFGKTAMGRDLLAQDYLLKQITASLIHPDTATGKQFWAEVYKQAYAKFGTTDIPIDTFNKVWITPDRARVYTNGNKAYIVNCKMKVLLESDYLAAQKAEGRRQKVEGDGQAMPGKKIDNPSSFLLQPSTSEDTASTDSSQALAKNILREIVIPVLTKEVNEGKNFATLRQIYHSLILSAWFKRKLKENLLKKAYADKNKNIGLEFDGMNEQAIYQQYLEAYKKGAFNFIKEETDATGEVVPHKYFSGGFTGDTETLEKAMDFTESAMEIPADKPAELAMVNLVPPATERAMLTEINPENQKRIQKALNSVYIHDTHKLLVEIMGHHDQIMVDIGSAHNDEPAKAFILGRNNRAIMLDPRLQRKTGTISIVSGTAENLVDALGENSVDVVYFNHSLLGILYEALENATTQKQRESNSPQAILEIKAIQTKVLDKILSQIKAVLRPNGRVYFLEIPQNFIDDQFLVGPEGAQRPGSLREKLKEFGFLYDQQISANRQTLLTAVVPQPEQAMINATAQEFDETYKHNKRYQKRGLAVYRSYFDNPLWQPFSADLASFRDQVASGEIGDALVADLGVGHGLGLHELLNYVDPGESKVRGTGISLTPFPRSFEPRKNETFLEADLFDQGLPIPTDSVLFGISVAGPQLQSARDAERWAAEWIRVMKTGAVVYNQVDQPTLNLLQPLRETFLAHGIQIEEGRVQRGRFVRLSRNSRFANRPLTMKALLSRMLLRQTDRRPEHSATEAAMTQALNRVNALIDKYGVAHGDQIWLETINLTAEDVAPAPGNKPMTFVSEPAKLIDVPSIDVALPKKSVILTSQFHNGTGSLIRLAALPEGTPVAIKKYLKNPRSSDDRARERAENLLLEDIRGGVIAQQAKMARIYGIFKDMQGDWNLVMGVAPGDFPQVSEKFITAETVSELRRARETISRAGWTMGHDSQFFVDQQGHLHIIDFAAIRRNTDLFNGSPYEGGYLLGLLRLILIARPEVGLSALQVIKTEDPPLAAVLKEYFLKVESLWTTTPQIKEAFSHLPDRAMKNQVPLADVLKQMNGKTIHDKTGAPYTVEIVPPKEGPARFVNAKRFPRLKNFLKFLDSNTFTILVNAPDGTLVNPSWLLSHSIGPFMDDYGKKYGKSETVGFLLISDFEKAWTLDAADFTPVEGQGLYYATIKLLETFFPQGQRLSLNNIQEERTAPALAEGKHFFTTPLGKPFSGGAWDTVPTQETNQEKNYVLLEKKTPAVNAPTAEAAMIVHLPAKTKNLESLIETLISYHAWKDDITVRIDPNLIIKDVVNGLEIVFFELIKNAIDASRVYKKLKGEGKIDDILITAERDDKNQVVVHITNRGILPIPKLREQAKQEGVWKLDPWQDPKAWPYHYIVESRMTDEPMPFFRMSDEEIDALSDEILLFQIRGLTLRSPENLARIGMKKQHVTGGAGLGLKQSWGIMKTLHQEHPIRYDTGFKDGEPTVTFSVALPLAQPAAEAAMTSNTAKDLPAKTKNLAHLIESLISKKPWKDDVKIELDKDLLIQDVEGLGFVFYELIKNAHDESRVYTQRFGKGRIDDVLITATPEDKDQVVVHITNRGILPLQMLRDQAKQEGVWRLKTPGTWPYNYMSGLHTRSDEAMRFVKMSNEEIDALPDEAFLFEINGLTLKDLENFARIGLTKPDITEGTGAGLKEAWDIMKPLHPEQPIRYATGVKNGEPTVTFSIALPLAQPAAEAAMEINKSDRVQPVQPISGVNSDKPKTGQEKKDLPKPTKPEEPDQDAFIPSKPEDDIGLYSPDSLRKAQMKNQQNAKPSLTAEAAKQIINAEKKTEAATVSTKHSAEPIADIENKIQTLFAELNIPYRKIERNEIGITMPTTATAFEAILDGMMIPDDGNATVLDLGSGQGHMILRLALARPNLKKIIGIEWDSAAAEDARQAIRLAISKGWIDPKKTEIEVFQGNFNDAFLKPKWDEANIIYYAHYSSHDQNALTKTIATFTRPGTRLVTYPAQTRVQQAPLRLLETGLFSVEHRPMVSIFTRHAEAAMSIEEKWAASYADALTAAVESDDMSRLDELQILLISYLASGDPSELHGNPFMVPRNELQQRIKRFLAYRKSHTTYLEVMMRSNQLTPQLKSTFANAARALGMNLALLEIKKTLGENFTGNVDIKISHDGSYTIEHPEQAMATDEKVADFEMTFNAIVEDAAKTIGKPFEAFTPQDWEQFSDAFIDGLDNRRWTIPEERKDIFVKAVGRILRPEHRQEMLDANILSAQGLICLLQRLHTAIATLERGSSWFSLLVTKAEPDHILNKLAMGMGERRAILKMSGITGWTDPVAAAEPFIGRAARKEFFSLVPDVGKRDPRAIAAVTKQFNFDPEDLINSTLHNLPPKERNGWWAPEVLEDIRQSFLEGMLLALTAAAEAKRHGIDPETYIGRGIDFVVLKGTLDGKPVALKIRMLHNDDVAEELKRNQDIRAKLKKKEYDFFVDDAREPIVVKIGKEAALVMHVAEYIEGQSLNERFLKTPSSPRNLAADMRLASQFLEIRKALARENLQDYDINGTPYNILIEKSGRLRQIDYGFVGPMQDSHEAGTSLALIRLMTGHSFEALKTDGVTRDFLARSLVLRYGMKSPQLAARIINAIFKLHSEMDITEFTDVWNKDLTKQVEKSEAAMEKAPSSATPFLSALPSTFLKNAINDWTEVNTLNPHSPVARLNPLKILPRDKGFVFRGSSLDFEKAIALWAGLIDGTEEGEQWQYKAKQAEARILPGEKGWFIQQAQDVAGSLSENINWHASGMGAISVYYDEDTDEGYVAVVDNGLPDPRLDPNYNEKLQPNALKNFLENNGFPHTTDPDGTKRLDIGLVNGGYLTQKSKIHRGDGIAMGHVIKIGNVIIISHGQVAEIAKRTTTRKDSLASHNYENVHKETVQRLLGSAIIVHIPSRRILGISEKDRRLGIGIQSMFLGNIFFPNNIMFDPIVLFNNIPQTLNTMPEQRTALASLTEHPRSALEDLRTLFFEGDADKSLRLQKTYQLQVSSAIDTAIKELEIFKSRVHLFAEKNKEASNLLTKPKDYIALTDQIIDVVVMKLQSRLDMINASPSDSMIRIPNLITTVQKALYNDPKVTFSVDLPQDGAPQVQGNLYSLASTLQNLIKTSMVRVPVDAEKISVTISTQEQKILIQIKNSANKQDHDSRHDPLIMDEARQSIDDMRGTLMTELDGSFQISLPVSAAAAANPDQPEAAMKKRDLGGIDMNPKALNMEDVEGGRQKAEGTVAAQRTTGASSSHFPSTFNLPSSTSVEISGLVPVISGFKPIANLRELLTATR